MLMILGVTSPLNHLDLIYILISPQASTYPQNISLRVGVGEGGLGTETLLGHPRTQLWAQMFFTTKECGALVEKEGINDYRNNWVLSHRGKKRL
jgi:hypothetical protein